jgi:hypothetical protein
MTVTVELQVSPEAFRLGDAMRTDPPVDVEIERLVPVDGGVVPYLWVYGDEGVLAEFESGVRGRAGVGRLEALDRLDGAALYSVTWERSEPDVVSALREADGTLLEAVGGEEWTFLVRFPDHAALSAFYNYCLDHGVAARVSQLRAPSPGRRRPDLTAEQREMLEEALARGYFEIPRAVSLGELAETFGISQQAASERLRRGVRQLATAALSDRSVTDL